MTMVLVLAFIGIALMSLLVISEVDDDIYRKK